MSKVTKPANWFYSLNRTLLHMGMLLKCRRIRFYGRENVPTDGSLLIASNHASFLDPPLVSLAAKIRFVRYLARDTLFEKKIANWFFRKSGVMPMDRKKGDIGALKQSIAMLKAGDCVGIFPEGTRTLDGKLREAKGGIGFLINKAGCPVLPMYIKGTFQAFPKGAEKIRLHPLNVYIGKPIPPEQLTLKTEKGKVDYEKIGALVMQRIADLDPGSE